jgi:lysyl-tRNA synthetase class 2
MASEEELREARLAKLHTLEEAGINPYPADSNETHTNNEVFSDFENLENKATKITIAGRIMSIRGQGKISFIDIYDGSATLQVVMKIDETPKYTDNEEISEALSFFQNTADIGDFIEVTGTVFITQKGQQSIAVQSWRILTKATLPIPDEHYGLKDDDERYRKRYLDILLDKEKKELFIKKAKFWSTMRNFLEAREFIEVHTPTLETTTGGAEAEPFTTHHNDLDIDVHMRISIGELWQKRLMAAGFQKTYEIGRAYRNEGTSPDHLQEFTNMEFYWAYADYNDGMKLVQELYRTIAKEVFGTTEFEARGHSFDLSSEWEVINYVEQIKTQTGINVLDTTESELQKFLESKEIKSEAKTFERLVDSTWKYCRKSISGPAFVVGYPDFMQPLAKRNAENKQTVEQFQVLLGGAEIGKGYSELNDPQDQRDRFEHQQKLREQGDEEAMMPDYDFLEMLEHGMPPTCGFGAGERLFAFLANKSIREVTLFPLMKPKEK